MGKKSINLRGHSHGRLKPMPRQFDVASTISVAVLPLAVQSRGTGAVSSFFGPITLAWFLVMEAAGVVHIGGDLPILPSFNPVYAVTFL
ncbi:K+ transporter [Ensifer mexicanus]|nr:K+ transporter [Sinorhizobium mexicanum]